MSGPITVVVADDNLIVREGVKAMLARESDIEVVGEAGDYDELVAIATEHAPTVVVTDIRMPPDFQREGIEAAQEVRRRHPGTSVVVLSQYDDPEYAVGLLEEGSAGTGYLLKQHVAEGDQLARAVRTVATGGTSLDPEIVDALTNPVAHGGLDPAQEELLRQVAEGKPIKAIAAAQGIPPAAAAERVEALFLTLAEQAGAGQEAALRRLRLLHRVIVDREEQGETLSRLLPGGVADAMRQNGIATGGDSELIDVTVLMSDIRGYSGIAERSDPAVLARQLNEHRAAMNRAVLDAGGTIMQFVGDAVMATFGAPLPQPDHARRSVAAAAAMHAAQAEVNRRWESEGLPPFGLGIGLSTGTVAAALLGSEERLEYTLVGDTVNLSQRLQQEAEPGQTVLSEATWEAVGPIDGAESLPPTQVKGREAPVRAWRLPAVTLAVPGGNA